MGKLIRSKREKWLRAIRTEMVEPIYAKKDAVKLAIQEAALAALKLPVKPSAAEDDRPPNSSNLWEEALSNLQFLAGRL